MHTILRSVRNANPHVEHRDQCSRICISDLGLPVYRRRVYAVLRKLDGCCYPGTFDFNADTLNKYSGREILASPTIYFRANNMEIRQMTDEYAHRCGFAPNPEDKLIGVASRLDCRSVLTMSMRKILEEHEVLWSEQRQWDAVAAAAELAEQPEEEAPESGNPEGSTGKTYYAQLSQTSKWGGKCMALCPTLIRNTTIWGEAEKRMLCAREHLGVQGFPVYASEHTNFKCCPIKHMLFAPAAASSPNNASAGLSGPGGMASGSSSDREPAAAGIDLSSRKIVQLLGNGMHQAAVGTAIVHAIASSVKYVPASSIE